MHPNFFGGLRVRKNEKNSGSTDVKQGWNTLNVLNASYCCVLYRQPKF